MVGAPYRGRPAVMGTLLDVTVRKRAEREAGGAAPEIEALYRASSRLLRCDSISRPWPGRSWPWPRRSSAWDATFLLAARDLLRRVACSRRRLGPGVLPLDGPGLTVLAARTGEIVSVADVTRHPALCAARAAAGSELAIPLTMGDRVLGVLDFESPDKEAFSGRDVLVLKAFADRAAMAIEQSQLHEHLHERTRQLERFHELAVMMVGRSADIYEAIARQVAELLATPYAGVVRVEGDRIRSLAVVSPATATGRATPSPSSSLPAG